MKTKLLREPMVVSGLEPLAKEHVLQEVREVLGYGVVDEAITLKRVADILDSLDIEPFDIKKVKAYKKEALAHANQSDGWFTYQWKRTLLKGYMLEVPAFALLRAAQVQKELNAANIVGHFEVEELKRTERKIPIDPFMVLVVGRQRLYIDVWDEPKFEGRRTL